MLPVSTFHIEILPPAPLIPSPGTELGSMKMGVALQLSLGGSPLVSLRASDELWITRHRAGDDPWLSGSMKG